jgi:DNA-binding HxlR family transcriptional regulator
MSSYGNDCNDFRQMESFNHLQELRRELQGVTQRVLTHQLRELEADGLVNRTVFAEVPPRVEYSLTPLGRTLIPVLENLELWARDHSAELLQTRGAQKCREQMEKQKQLSDMATAASVN